MGLFDVIPDTQTLFVGLDAPARGAFTITPSDSIDLDPPIRAVYIGGSGDVAVETWERETVTFTNLLYSYVLPIRCRKVLSSGTTATGLVGMY